MKNIYLLDADDTLLDFKRGEREKLQETFAAYGVNADESVLTCFHRINVALWQKLERGEIERKKLVVERFRLLFDEIGVAADPAAVSGHYFSLMQQAAYFIDGAEEFLRTLKKTGRVYIVTNGSREVQRSRFALSGLNGYADGTFISEEVGCDKPSPAYAAFVEAHIPDYDRARAVWVGDSLSSDCACAKTKGIEFILFGADKPNGYDGLFARNYHEVLQILEKI